jgi:plasmid stabilization system protein ParE
VLSAAATANLTAIGDYIAKDSPGRAVSFVQNMRTAATRLGEMPEASRLVPRYARQGIRRYLHRNYLIFYRIEADRVVIIRVLHGARDYESVLFPDCY